MYDKIMRKAFLVLLILLFVLTSLRSFIYASSDTAYQDYLYQFDLYRQTYTDFQVAKNEYQKFKSLESQTAALDKTRIMLAQRDQLLRAYLFLLNEKLNENTGMGSSEKLLYQTLIRNEVAFLETHAKLIPSIGSLDDAGTISKQLESHYLILQKSMRQAIVGISVGKLTELRKQFDTTFATAQTLINATRGAFIPEKQATMDRWVLQINNKKSLYQQKIDSINSSNSSWDTNSLDEMNRKFLGLQGNVASAKQELQEGSSFLGELVNTLRYQD